MNGPVFEMPVSSASCMSHEGIPSHRDEINEEDACTRESSGSGSKKDSLESVVSSASSDGDLECFSPATAQVELCM